MLLVHAAADGAGFARIEVPAAADGPKLQAMVWSPCAKGAGPVRIGPYAVAGVADCEVSGRALPLIVISHGKGGSMLGHHDTAIALADAGFVAVALNHSGDSFGDDAATHQLKVFETRPRDVSRLVSFMITGWPQREQLNAQAIGVFGFSRGGYTALALAGAVPSASASAERYCGRWWTIVLPLCRQVKAAGAQLRPSADPRVRAVVAADPLNLFDAPGLQSVRVPVQLWASALGGDGVELAHVEAVKAGLREAPDYHVAAGAGHFAYLAPCSAEMTKAAAEICRDPDGFDRVAWHQQMNAAVISFFRRHLPATPRP